MWSLQLTVASVLTALAPSLQRLHHTFTCFIPWADALLPLGAGGGGALRSLHLDRCHLASLAGLGAMGGSLTELSISLCEGFADSHVLPGLPATLRALPLLESLTLDTLCSDPGGWLGWGEAREQPEAERWPCAPTLLVPCEYEKSRQRQKGSRDRCVLICLACLPAPR